LCVFFNLILGGDAVIRKHCDKARNNMQLAIEKAQLNLHDSHESFSKVIDEFEEQCQANFNLVMSKKNEFENIFNDIDVFCLNSTNLMKSHVKNELQVISFVEKGHFLLNDLENKTDKLKSELFNNYLLKFESKPISSEIVGNIKKQNIDLRFLENIDKKGVRRIKLDITMLNVASIPHIYSFNFNYLIFDKFPRQIITFFCIDNEGKEIYREPDLLKCSNIEIVLSFEVFITTVNTFIYFFTKEKHFKNEISLHYLRCFDKNFHLTGETAVIEPVLCDGNIEDFYILSKDESLPFYKIKIYNHKAEIKAEIGKMSESGPFFFPRSIDKMIFQKDFLIFSLTKPILGQEKSFKILRRTHGFVERIISDQDGFDILRLYLDVYILTFNNQTLKLKTYNLTGDLICEIILDKQFEGSMLYILDKELAFSNEDCNIFII
jgi:hypothetical protein